MVINLPLEYWRFAIGAGSEKGEEAWMRGSLPLCALTRSTHPEDPRWRNHPASGHRESMRTQASAANTQPCLSHSHDLLLSGLSPSAPESHRSPPLATLWRTGRGLRSGHNVSVFRVWWFCHQTPL